VNWSKTYAGQYVHRVDAGASGNSVVMTATETNPDDETIGGGVKIIAHTAAGIQLFANNGVSQYTSDVAIDEPSQTVVGIGFKNFDTNDALGGPSLPVYVPVYRGYDFAGVQKYVGYDWGKDSASPNWLNLAANNMADVRTSRCVIGADGKLYITFEVYGGNHILRYSPFNNTQTVPIVAGDMYFNFSNTGTEVKTFVGRYEPATGVYVLGQQFTARINPPLNKGNSVFARNGSVAADATGRVYLTGQSAFGIPITINHQPGEYLGGAFVLVLSPNLAVRESCIRLTLGSGKAIATNGNGWCYGGATSASLYAVLPLQATKAAGNDGFYAVVAGTPTPVLAPNNIVAKTIKNNTLQNINVYPNPSNGLVNVSLENIKGDYTIQLTDVKGQVIYNQSGNAADNDLLQLNTDNLESGIYIVRFVNEGYSSARQLVIKK
jgi:hypothetical protein